MDDQPFPAFDQADDAAAAAPPPKPTRTARRTHADPNAPRKPPTAFMAYSNDHRAELLKAHPDQAKNVKAIASILGAMWRELPEEEKSRYKDIYHRKKAEYDDALREYYTANPDAKDRDDAFKRVKRLSAAAKRSRGHGASGGPKRALTPFFCFVRKYRPVVKAEHPDAKPTEVTSKVAKLWGALTEEQRKEYQLEAEKDRERYNKECIDQGVEPSSVKRARRLAGRDAAAAGRAAAVEAAADAEVDAEGEDADEEDEDVGDELEE